MYVLLEFDFVFRWFKLWQYLWLG